MKKLKIGIVGLGCRGRGLTSTLLSVDECEITAVCDIRPERVEDEINNIFDATGRKVAGYTDYKELISSADVEAVVDCPGWEAHVEVAIYALRHGKPVGMEVGGAYDVEDCYDLVRAQEESGTPFMFLENCCFDKFELLSTSLVRSGKLGEIVHLHGAYSHDLRDEILGGAVRGHYRLQNYIHRNCENYPTHEVGPIAKILNINRGNRFVSLVSVASKARGLEAYAATPQNPDPSLAGARFNQGDVVTTVITCAGGETVTLTLDTTLPKYYSREFTVRGTKGLAVMESNMVMIEGDQPMHEFFEPSKTIRKYIDNAEEYSEYLPSFWRSITEEERKLGHGGMDYFMLREFCRCILSSSEPPIDVYDGATWMAITALSERSIAQGGAPQAFPDFTRGKWHLRPPRDVVELPVK